ncbi:hypothetical protein SAMN05421866_3494 [Chryseobacterium oranimense]|uniref:Uncharacterized protein n=1 Tax=Chryseobacterium oranimense TaxID=421058 RepID=A0A1M5V1A0_9FLAO|nr:hypothetical protein [Chryseobacterium oranimense]SHH68999.1 hypothetical protein SAMN05421866_3494 [Chryseobacterium oranimense]
MELYIYFTNRHNDENVVSSMKESLKILKETSLFAEIIEDDGYFQIIGQAYGEDTSVGDPDLHANLYEFGYHWINANFPNENNLISKN